MDAQTITGSILLNQQELIDELLKKKHDHFDDEKSDQQSRCCLSACHHEFVSATVGATFSLWLLKEDVSWLYLVGKHPEIMTT